MFCFALLVCRTLMKTSYIADEAFFLLKIKIYPSIYKSLTDLTHTPPKRRFLVNDITCYIVSSPCMDYAAPRETISASGGMCMYLCVCVHVHMCVCVCVYVSVCLCPYVCLHVHLSTLGSSFITTHCTAFMVQSTRRVSQSVVQMAKQMCHLHFTAW